MQDYLKFCWDSLIHPERPEYILAPIQLILFFIFWYFAIRALIDLYKYHKQQKMAKIKSNPIQGYFFMGITDGELNVDCTGDSDVLSAAFATLIISKEKNEKGVQQILSNAVTIASEHLAAKEKYSSKTAKKPVKKATKSVKKEINF